MYKILSLLSLILLLSVTAMLAQNNSEVRLVITEPAECANNILYVDIEVRAASIADTFRLSYQNYRLTFDSNLVGDPKIETELELSGFVTDGTGTACLYDTHILGASVGSMVSYVVNHSGWSDGYLLTTDWVSVGRLSFDILANVGCFNFSFIINYGASGTYVHEITPMDGLVATNVSGIDLYDCIENLCPVSTEEIDEEASWGIFPNPVSNVANVQLEQTDLEDRVVVEVLDVSGQLVYTEMLSDDSFNTTSLLPGMYLVQLKTDNWQSAVRKLVKLK